ncbi:MAG: hypothetical protein KC643_05600 [Nitrospira sp.]|nr:hypothetical protein [Nitrospira sp.]MCA9480334.1 hypothetical protein [Nitrospira sp.]MCB9710353.1 hypothetical protein [Nitrospiraceae bacterium]MDR4488854.1 hypothetical protein [Nitrospirales bacterium]
MALKKGDIIDEHQRYPDSCGLVLKVMHGGEGFEKIICCGHELTEDDVVPAYRQERGRKRGQLLIGMTLDEKKVRPDSCGFRVMIMDGGAGFQEIRCCGNSIRAAAMEDLSFGQMRSKDEGNTSQSGTA